jgi:Uma2 family endonuclease
MYDLPSEDPMEPGLPNEFHDLQPQLLSRTLSLSQYTKQEMFSVSDMNLYYDLEHPNWYKRPDWFLVVGVPRRYRGETSRSSYVLWDEQVSPIVVVEFLSPGTEGEDLGRFAPNPPESKLGQPPCKFEVYEQIVQVQNYIVYDEPTTTLRYFRLVDGQYQEQSVGQQNPRLWIPELEIGLGLWEGEFEGLKQPWLRWCDYIGEFFLTDTEAAIAQLRQTVKNLLNLGMPVPQIAQITGLSESEVQEMAN